MTVKISAPCTTCKGEGKQWVVDIQNIERAARQIRTPCSTCGGTGVVEVVPYQRFNQIETNFIDERVKHLQDQLTIYTNERVWDAIYNMDGVTEYIAQDLIEAQVWQHLKIRGVRYEMYEDGMSVPTVFKELTWTHGNGWITSMQVYEDFERAMPLVMTDLNKAISFIVHSKDAFVLERYRTESNILVNWKAQVNESEGVGNLPGWAVVHAWGKDRGIWS